MKPNRCLKDFFDQIIHPYLYITTSITIKFFSNVENHVLSCKNFTIYLNKIKNIQKHLPDWNFNPSSNKFLPNVSCFKKTDFSFFAFSGRLFLANFPLSLDNFLNKGEKRLKTEVKNPRRTWNTSARKNQSLF